MAKIPGKKPNVIVVITDDQGYGDLGCHGNPVADTPHLDQLHDESVRLEDFHVAPMCTPTRGQLLSGLDAARNGAVNVSSGRALLRPELRTMADVYHDAGYRTGLFGKWHLGDNYPYRPEDRGFEETLWFPSSHISSLPDYWENDYFDDVYCQNGMRKRFEGYCTQVFFREAKAWMKQCADRGESFMAYLPTNAPHAPLWVPREDREAMEAIFAERGDCLPKLEDPLRSRLIRFLAMIRNLDREIGALRAFLREEDLERDTILVFLTDNGSTFGDVYYNAGMRGRKSTLWEGGHRVPCFIHWPDGGFGEPRSIGGLTQAQDILPTLMECCGLADQTLGLLDGVSLLGALRGEVSVPDRYICVNYSRMPSFDYPSPDSQAIIRREGAAVLWQRWRLLECVALYNLDDDPAQERNVIDEHPEIVRTMTAELDAWWAKVEPVANEFQRIIIGSDHENPLLLTACEWSDVFVDQQLQVRVGTRKNSYWHLQVDCAGTYEFELRRWPRESGLKLRDACPKQIFSDDWDHDRSSAGQAIPLSKARIMINRRGDSQVVNETDDCAVFTVTLEPGPTYLHTWFDDERGEPVFGAYYVYVRRR